MVFACLQTQVAYKLIKNIKKVENSECFSPTKSSDFTRFEPSLPSSLQQLIK